MSDQENTTEVEDDRLDTDVFSLWNAAEDVEPQERNGDFNDEEWHNEVTAPAGEALPVEVVGLKVGKAKTGSFEFRIQLVDVSAGEHDGRRLTIKKYISNKSTSQAYNAAIMVELSLIGLTNEVMATKPSYEAMAEVVKAKGAKLLVFPAWEPSRDPEHRDEDGNVTRYYTGINSYIEPFVDNDVKSMDEI